MWKTSYPEALRDYQVDPLLAKGNLSDLGRESAKNFTSDKAFTFVADSNTLTSLSYRQIDSLSDDLGRYFQKTMQLKRGDVVAIQLLNSLHILLRRFRLAV